MRIWKSDASYTWHCHSINHRIFAVNYKSSAIEIQIWTVVHVLLKLKNTSMIHPKHFWNDSPVWLLYGWLQSCIIYSRSENDHHKIFSWQLSWKGKFYCHSFIWTQTLPYLNKWWPVNPQRHLCRFTLPQLFWNERSLTRVPDDIDCKLIELKSKSVNGHLWIYSQICLQNFHVCNSKIFVLTFRRFIICVFQEIMGFLW